MNRLIYILLAITGLVFLSCEKFLDRPPLDAIGNDSYWKTAGDLERYVLKYYEEFPGHNNSMALEDSNSDNLIRAVPESEMNGENPVTTGNWVNDWKDIRSINIFFDNYGKVQDDLVSYRQFLGEAHFFKAWFYFNLLKKYGPLPWYTTSLEPNSEELLKARDSRTLVADSILANIDKAIAYLGKRATVGNTRLNKEAALAFKTRVALYEGTWQKYHADTPFGTPGADPAKYFRACVDAAEELIRGDYITGLYSTGNPATDYYTLFGLDNMNAVNEVLLYKAYNQEAGLGSNVQFYTTVRTGQMAATWSLVNSYLGKDGEEVDYLELAGQYQGNDFLKKMAELADPRLHATIWIPGDLRVAATNELFDKPFIDKGAAELCATGFQVRKFSNPASPAAGNLCCGLSETGYILFRFAETLLNYAEARYELDGTVAYDALNLLRQRAGMPDFVVRPQAGDPNPVDYGYPIPDALYEIRRERRVELALEGFRGDDYKRWAAHALFQGKRPLGYPFKSSEFPAYDPPLNSDGLIDYFQAQLPNGYQFREERDYLDDIPQDELVLNPNLEQNPGW